MVAAGPAGHGGAATGDGHSGFRQGAACRRNDRRDSLGRGRIKNGVTLGRGRGGSAARELDQEGEGQPAAGEEVKSSVYCELLW